MVMLTWKEPQGVFDIQRLVQNAIDLEFATLPPYLYAKFTILPGTNAAALALLDSIIRQEMIHMCLACNILNAIGGTPAVTPPHYPGPLPGGVAKGLTVGLLPFTPAAIAQGMAIEAPDEPIKPRVALAIGQDEDVSIGEYYHRIDIALSKLPASDWTVGRNQIGDAQFFQGQIFDVNGYADAHRAINQIVSEGEGTPVRPDQPGSPLDFQHDLAHYYRFWEIAQNRVLTQADDGSNYTWGAPLGVDWQAAYPAIANPQEHDFAHDPAPAQAAQAACDAAFTAMVDALGKAFAGSAGELGVAVRAMFDLRMAAMAALNAPLADGTHVSGPAFVYLGGQATTTQTEGAAA